MCKILLSISLLIAPIALLAQSADDYFHQGAQLYIWGKKPEARTTIMEGLRLFPSDRKLAGMAELLKKEEQEQQQKQQQQDKQDKQNQDSKKDQVQKSQPQNSQSQENKSDQEKNSSQQQSQQKEEDKKQQQAAEQAQKEKEQQQAQKQEKKNAQPQEKPGKTNLSEGPVYAAGEMTPRQAQQLLDAQKNDDMLLPAKKTEKPLDRSKPLRDW